MIAITFEQYLYTYNPPENQKVKEPITECERAKRASRNFCMFASKTYDSSQYDCGKSYVLPV